jgi:hypothetical protein
MDRQSQQITPDVLGIPWLKVRRGQEFQRGIFTLEMVARKAPSSSLGK